MSPLEKVSGDAFSLSVGKYVVRACSAKTDSQISAEIAKYPDIEQYDTILLGYCNWWSSIPASVRSFLMHDDFSGKTIVPFCSMGGGRFGQTISAIAKLAPNSVIKEGLEVTYSSYDRAEIREWLNHLAQ